MFYSLESWQMQSSKTKRRARGKVCKFVWVQGQMARLRNSFTVIVRVNNRSHWLCECGLLKKQQQQHIYRFFETRRDVVIYFFSSEIWVHVLKNMAPESRNNTTAGWQWTHHADVDPTSPRFVLLILASREVYQSSEPLKVLFDRYMRTISCISVTLLDIFLSTSVRFKIW